MVWISIPTNTEYCYHQRSIHIFENHSGFYSLDEGPINNYPISIKSPITNGIVTMGTSCIPEIQLEFKKMYQAICSYKLELKEMIDNMDPEVAN